MSPPLYRQRRRARQEGSDWQKDGYDSRFEWIVSQRLLENGYDFTHQPDHLKYIKQCKYTPDFLIVTRTGKKIYIETKGYWKSDERSKHKMVCKQNPEIDLRLVFMNANNKLNKNSKTTYASWCDKYKIKWADKYIPEAWFDE